MPVFKQKKNRHLKRRRSKVPVDVAGFVFPAWTVLFGHLIPRFEENPVTRLFSLEGFFFRDDSDYLFFTFHKFLLDNKT